MNFNGSWYCIRFYATQSLLSRETAREPRNLFCPIVQITGTNEQNSKKKNATAHPYFGHVRVEWLYKHRYTVPESEKKKKGKTKRQGISANFYVPDWQRKTKTGIMQLTWWLYGEKKKAETYAVNYYISRPIFSKNITIDPKRYYIVLLLILIFETNFTRAGIKHKFLS